MIHKQSINFEEPRPLIKTVDEKKFYFFFIHLNYFHYDGFRVSFSIYA